MTRPGRPAPTTGPGTGAILQVPGVLLSALTWYPAWIMSSKKTRSKFGVENSSPGKQPGAVMRMQTPKVPKNDQIPHDVIFPFTRVMPPECSFSRPLDSDATIEPEISVTSVMYSGRPKLLFN